MNILYITNHLNAGGIARYISTLASGMRSRGHAVWVASSGGEFLRELTACGCEHISVQLETKSELSPMLWGNIPSLARLVSRKHIDVIHSHTRTTQVVATMISRWTGIPHVWTCHGFFKRRLGRRLFPCWGKINIAISDAVKNHLVSDWGLAVSRIATIYNGIDIAYMCVPAAAKDVQFLRTQLGLPQGPVVGIIARLSDVKGHLYLIKAMQQVISVIPTAQLLIVGEGKMKAQLMAMVDELGIKKNVVMVPACPDMRIVLALFDVFVLPSLAEGLGLSIMEAMACGKAVIGSRIGGISNIIDHNVHGLLVPPADAVALAQAIELLLSDAGLRQRLQNAASQRIHQRFSAEEMIQKTERAYLSCA